MATTIQNIELPKKPRARDTSGNNNHGKIYSGRGLEFDGVTDYLQVPASAETDFAEGVPYTWSTWVNFAGFDTWFLGLNRSHPNVMAITSGQLAFREAGANAAYYYLSSTKLNLNTWYRLVVTADASNNMRLYINGVLDHTLSEGDSPYSGSGTFGVGGSNLGTDFQILRIGSGYSNNAYGIEGMMSNFQVWDKAWTATDVTYDYLNPESLALNASGTALTEGNLKLWYPMQDGHRGQQSYILDGANTGLGEEMVQNGSFDNGTTNWIKGSATSSTQEIINGALRMYTGDGSASPAGNSNTLSRTSGYSMSGVSGVKYRLRVTASDFSAGTGSIRLDGVYLAGAAGSIKFSAGTQDVYFVAYRDFSYIKFMAPSHSHSYTIDNVSLKPINDKHHATTVFHGDDLWNKADNDVATWVATAATSVASSEVAIGGTTDGVKLIYGSQNGNHSSYAQFSSSKFLSEDLVVGREYTVSGLFATDVVGNTNAPGVAVYASGFNYPTGFASAAANIIPATNLVTNGTFEVDDNWATYNSANVNARSDTQAHNGTYSRKFTPDSTSEGIQSDTFTTVTGTTYLVSFWVYPDDGTIVRSAVRNGGTGAWAKDVSTTDLEQDAWNKVEYQYTENNGGANAYIIIHSNTQTSGDFYVDDVVVTAFLEREITFTSTNTTGDYLAALNIPSTADNNLITDDKNSIFDESSINSSSGWQSYVGSGGTSVVSYDATDDEVTFSTTTNGAIEGMKLEDENYTALEIGRTYTVKINMRAAAGTPTVKVRLGLSNIVTDAITTSDVDYNFSVTPVNITSSLLVYLQDTSGIDITVSKVEIFPHCNLFVDDISFKEVGVASGWTDADQQLHIPQTALQSYNELAWFDGTIASDGYVDLDSAITTSGNSWSLSFWVFHDDNGQAFDIILGDGANQFIALGKDSDDKLQYRDSSNVYHAISDAAIPESEWVHITITATANTSITAYVNGVAQTTNSDMTNTTLLLERFMRGFSSASYQTFGTINEISYYNDVLTATEVLDLYNDGKAKSALEASGSAGLVGYWRNNGLSEWKDLKGSNDGNTSAGVVETILIPEGVDATRDSQGFLMNKKRSTGSLNLDGVGYASLPTMAVTTDDFTFEAWAKAESNITHESVIMEVGASMLLFGNNHGYIRAVDGTFTNQLPTHSFVLGNWYHIVVTRIRNGNQIMYVDGVAKNTVTAPDTAMTLSDTTIGKDNTTRTSSDVLDAVKVYSAALSATEVLQNYNATKRDHKN